MSGCVQNTLNATVFVRFTVLRKFEFSVSRGRMTDLGFILDGFWRPWGHFSSFLRVPERCWNLDGFSMSAVGPERSARGGRTSSLGLSSKIEEEEKRRS